jgi:predicted short-subunit dehydrogenase-like oxidoreductase (DUF2520 family)
VVRGDVRTVERHLAELARLAGRDPSTADVPASYRVLARAATTRALAGGRLRPDQAQALLDVLAGPPGAPDGPTDGPPDSPSSPEGER